MDYYQNMKFENTACGNNSCIYNIIGDNNLISNNEEISKLTDIIIQQSKAIEGLVKCIAVLQAKQEETAQIIETIHKQLEYDTINNRGIK